MIPRELLGSVEVSVQVTVDTPLPIFVQVFIPMGLSLTIWRSYAGGKLAVLSVGEEKTPGGQSGRHGGSSKAGDKVCHREAGVWLRAKMCNYNQEVLIR